MMFCLIFTSLFFCSYLSTLLKNQFDHTAEAILPALINLIPNSAKVINLFYFFLAHSLLFFVTRTPSSNVELIERLSITFTLRQTANANFYHVTKFCLYLAFTVHCSYS